MLKRENTIRFTSCIKKHIKKWLSQFFLADKEEILSAMQSVSVVSFDLFDTLIKRKVPSPEDVHILVDKRYSEQTGQKIMDYQTRRILAEMEAREISGSREITLKDIFSCFSGLTEEEKATLQDLEMQTEYDVCTPNQYMKSVYDKALADHKTVIITSDMYLPEMLIRRILEKCGYNNYRRLFLSSEKGVTKSSGKLFDALLAEMKSKPDCILHIGDHIKSDYFRPKQKGIKASLIAAK